ncbi:hypothetical protein, conserved [Plasmodium gonderi]|uniref:Dual specificity protein phosphatase n=1 Tax=Plasmodium gonderi TaxID=77519 RepID=A0A1Y1JC63_PLAGO|nr:hypothetical protein, conserved [Plasmodium gonderi]GAW79830.1 hypothetical protein, conserved [Plasmodium gonderi]
MVILEGTHINQLPLNLFLMGTKQCNGQKGEYKKELKEIITRVYIGDYEDSKNILLLSSIGITHIIIIRCSEECQMARIVYPHKFDYYIIDLKNDYDFIHCTHLKFLLDEILFQNVENRVFIHSYISLKKILSLLVFYITTTLNYDVEDVLTYIKKIVPDFSMTIEESDKIYYFKKRHRLTYYPGECTNYHDVTDSKEKAAK